MSELIINGGRKLHGDIDMHGAKNSVLPILAATVLCSGQCILHNCPNLSDVDISLKILTELGCVCEKVDEDVYVDASYVNNFCIRDELMREMRSSVIFLGAILGRMGKAVISNPGGCELGPRPIDLHISSLKKLGAFADDEHGYLSFSAPYGLTGSEIYLALPSVGATENIILASVFAKNKTVIHNAAKEPEISDLANFLNSAGAKIYGAGTDTVTIIGVKRLDSTEHTIIPDRIATVTYMVAAAVTKGDITINKVNPSHISSVMSVFNDAGCQLEISKEKIHICAPKRLKAVPTIRTLTYPGFPTDAGPLVMAMLSIAEGTTIFVENIFESRFKYIDELNRFGSNIKTEGKIAIIEGVEKLYAANCECTDLRGGAALAIAALSANGETHIRQIKHIKRGYDDIRTHLEQLGADIREV